MPRTDIDFIIAVIPNERAPVALIQKGKLVETNRILNRTTSVQKWLETHITSEPWKGRLVIQAPPWRRVEQNPTEVYHVRNLTETAMTWRVLCDVKGIRHRFVARTKWITGLLSAGRATRSVETSNIDTVTAAEALSKQAVDKSFADVVCLGYWYYHEPASEGDVDELVDEQV